MTYQPHYIASYEENSGLFTYTEPFLAPEKAFPILEDAYCWRGRTKRREGNVLLGRLRRSVTFNLTAADGTGVYNNADVLATIRAAQPNAEIQHSNPPTSYLTVTIAFGGGNVTTYNDRVTPGVLTYIAGTYTITAGTINYVTGAISLTFSVAPPITTTVRITTFYFPGLPVMGLPQYDVFGSILFVPFAFDTIYAYFFNFATGFFEELVPGTTWSGTDIQLFWTTSYYTLLGKNLIWTTNFNYSVTPDPIRYYDGAAWNNFGPAVDGTNFLLQCLIILPYKDRLVVMDTIEGVNFAGLVRYQNRIRWSQNGDPTNGDPTAWLDNVVGKGGYLDIPTNEVITSAEFVKDILLVKCATSSWKLVYTGNETLPFNIQKVNTEIGSTPTFSTVPFDKGVLSIGSHGITIDDSVNVIRIDREIPNIVFDMNNNAQGVFRIYGVRDYVNELVYWSYPDASENPKFPNKVLCYNYVNESYAVFHDSYTCLGQFQRFNYLTWATLPYPTWIAWNTQWNEGPSFSLYPDVVGGNQQGYVVILHQQVPNDTTLAITAITPGVPGTMTIPNHNFQTGQWIKVVGILGTANIINGFNFYVIVIDSNTISVQLFDTLSQSLVFYNLSGTYIGGGQIISINNINITTKIFAPFYEEGGQVRVGYIDYLFDTTPSGEVSVNFYIDENNTLSMNDPTLLLNDGLLGTNEVNTSPDNLTLIPFQAQQKKIWHRQFIQAIAQNFQIQIFMSDAQMSQDGINDADIVLHAMSFYLSKNARLTQ